MAMRKPRDKTVGARTRRAPLALHGRLDEQVLLLLERCASAPLPTAPLQVALARARRCGRCQQGAIFCSSS